MHFNLKGLLIRNGFFLDANRPQIYINLYTAFKKAILNRSLETGSKLPPSRVLANDLGISRSTVLKAIDLLLVENYVVSKKGSGYYVCPPQDKKIKLNFSAIEKKGGYPTLSKKGRAFGNNAKWMVEDNNTGVAFRPGLPPLDIFPVQIWKKLIDEYWKHTTPSELSYCNTIGLQCLRENLSHYLRVYRDIHCHPDQIIITTGSLHSLYLVANVLLEQNDEVIVEDPTYPMAHNLFKSLGASICTAQVDAEGLNLSTICCQHPKFVYTTPSCQYPLGIKMSMKRRRDVLKWAAQKETYVIEDDYNHEFSNWEKPLGSLYGMAPQQRVIYLGTFNKLIHPSLRLGYMIVPDQLMDAVIGLYKQSSRFASRENQKAMSTFIEKDYLNKHLRRVIDTATERKEVFVHHFNTVLGDSFSLDHNSLGLHLIAHNKLNTTDTFVEQKLLQHNIRVHALSKYHIGPNSANGMVMGFCSVNPKQIKETIQNMGNVIEQLKI
ncbi:PLP-dependent aminotransferase family protein [Muricauda sp. 334s03]|uniref:PLP-dependent aminotransferase family protein n=1 Tax=Flagellimonas yonaguniensis TaxID=3031325 RepID=A0ABT5XXS2_9FLAO|nr:PLP-dependent aminotransferase family protein [[Muricauda] yonaguniensis]MDF0715987.1 PLP-dependent aminotransferase family protein [[Muricauda] yonaguniensis]